MRVSGRAEDAPRPVSSETGFSRHAEGSCLIRLGGTEVLCAASVESRVPAGAETTPFSDARLAGLMRLARLGTAQLHVAQPAALETR